VPFNYLFLAWVTIFGFAIWGEALLPELLLSSAIIVAAGLYPREATKQRHS
jgi:hypothetical protein